MDRSQSDKERRARRIVQSNRPGAALRSTFDLADLMERGRTGREIPPLQKMHTCQHITAESIPHSCPYQDGTGGAQNHQEAYCNCCATCQAECQRKHLDYMMFGTPSNWNPHDLAIKPVVVDPISATSSGHVDVFQSSGLHFPLNPKGVGDLCDRFPFGWRELHCNDERRNGCSRSRFATTRHHAVQER